MDFARVCAAAAIATLWCHQAWAQQPEPAAPAAHQHGEMPPPAAASNWHLMQDGVVYGLFNHQGGPRGGTEFVVPNWWMGMLMRGEDRHRFGLNAMLSLDPVTVGRDGYRELFQVGESLDGRPLVDRQHPHDLLMQLSASWKVAFSGTTSLVVAGGPAGEPTLGPVAFMHRASAAGLPLAPLGHHTFDSTHISFGVVTAAIEHGRWTVEGSVFNGREPDEHRWDFDLGPMDSVAGRVWFRPAAGWAVQLSTGLLREPEELAPGDARRSTASVSWMSAQSGLRALTAGYGVTAAHDIRRQGAFVEYTREDAVYGLSGRLEIQQVESGILITQGVADHHDEEATSTLAALTLSVARPLGGWRGFEAALAAQATTYAVPSALRATHGRQPVSFQAFLRVRLPSGPAGRMWNMRMSAGPSAINGHAGHTMP